ncbi:MAG TPA: hypothetical protein VLA25_01165 [Methylotenera sp.]|nr:hypothetical protein [Methylotenera sp.]
MLSFIKKLFKPKLVNAALAWQQLGNDAGTGYWLYAAPVHLVLQRDTFSLAAPVPLPLEAEEISALTSTLNTHFEADNLKFFWHDNQWFLRLAINPNIQTTPPEKVVNKDINTFLPAGEGAIKWAAFTNELQMLLFAHPINQVREEKSLPVINSVWCYGGGQVQAINRNDK